MPKSKPQKPPRHKSLEQLVDFFDSHDMGDYWESLPEAHFEVNLKRKNHFFALDADLAQKLSQIAKARQTPSQELIHFWLKEKILEQAPTAS
jgi:hypothetical protein